MADQRRHLDGAGDRAVLLIKKPSTAADRAAPISRHPQHPRLWLSVKHVVQTMGMAAKGLKAGCSIPLVNRGRVLGILSILRTTETPFSPEDIDFLSRASGQIAIAIENALAFQEVSSLGARLQRLRAPELPSRANKWSPGEGS